MLPGTYRAIVTGTRWTTSQGGNAGLTVNVDVDDNGDFVSMFGTIWFTPKSMGMARGQLKALGFDPDHQHVRDIGGEISLVDQRCEVQVVEEDYKGQKQIKIGRFGGGPKPPSPELLASLDAKLAKAKKSGDDDGEDDAYHGPSLPPPPQPPAEPVPLNPPPAVEDSGIPF